MDFAELPPPKIKALSQLSLAAREEKKSLCCSKKEDFYLRSSKLRLGISSKTSLNYCAIQWVNVGFISSDFGVHPVAQLVRGLLSFINKDQFTVSLHHQILYLYPLIFKN
jgi:predicted O-linked N-acetylglucosamine transferase (SPINDLY family)